MSEPQNDEYVEEIQHVETNDSVSDSETDNQVQDESNEQAEPIVDEVEAERKRKEQDAFDDDYEQKIQARDEAIRAQAQFNYSQQSHQQAQQAVQQQAAQAREQDVHVSMESYTRKATELGIKQEELQAAGNKVGSYGLSEDLVMHILKDTDGPLITKHLAANPQDGYELASMSPFAVGQFLDGIKQKASALKPKTSNAPKPATNLQGNGVDPEAGKYRYSEGATFE